ncbi:hypothetical protein VTK26DRAFT_8178 [Humicola hyalothermophila]
MLAGGWKIGTVSKRQTATTTDATRGQGTGETSHRTEGAEFQPRNRRGAPISRAEAVRWIPVSTSRSNYPEVPGSIGTRRKLRTRFDAVSHEQGNTQSTGSSCAAQLDAPAPGKLDKYASVISS